MIESTWEAHGYIFKFLCELPVHEEIAHSVVLPDWLKIDSPVADAVISLESTTQPDSMQILLDGEVKLKGLTLESGRDNLRRLCHLHLAIHCRRHTFVHAGVVSFKQCIILIPGHSGCGKSTLVKALVEEGCRYLSDEYAPADDEGLVCPFPRPLRERLGRFGHRYIPAESLNWSPAMQPMAPRLIVFSSYSPGECCSLRQLESAESVLRLFEHTVTAKLEPERVIRTLKRIVSTSLCLSGARGEAEEAAKCLLDILRPQAELKVRH